MTSQKLISMVIFLLIAVVNTSSQKCTTSKDCQMIKCLESAPLCWDNVCTCPRVQELFTGDLGSSCKSDQDCTKNKYDCKPIILDDDGLCVCYPGGGTNSFQSKLSEDEKCSRKLKCVPGCKFAYEEIPEKDDGICSCTTSLA